MELKVLAGQKRFSAINAWSKWAGVFVVVILLYWLSRHNYLQFHSGIEVFSTVVAGSVFLLTMILVETSAHAFFVIIGCGQGVVAGFTLLHMAAYKGMGIIGTGDANLPTQLWIATRLMDSGALFVGIFMIGKSLGAVGLKLVLGTFSAIAGVLLGSLFVWPVFPDCFIEGVGLTPFKFAMEYAMMAVLAYSLWQLHAGRDNFTAAVLRRIEGAYALRIVAGMFFTLYTDVYGLTNMLGHLAIFVSYLLLADALVWHMVREPQAIWFWEMKESKAALRKSEEKNLTILQSTKEGFWLIGSDGRMIDVNEAYCTMSGYNRDEFLGLQIADIDADEAPAETLARIARIHDTGAELFETRHRRKDGSVFSVEISSTFLPNSGGQLICFCRDITGRKRAEEAQRESERRLRLAQVVTNTGYFSFDVKAGIWQSSVVLNSIYGIDEAFVRDVPHWIALIVPAQRPKILAQFNEVLQKGLRWDVEYMIIRPVDGQERWITSQAEFDYDAAGNPIHLTGFIQDITERKQADVELRKLSFAVEQSPATVVITDLDGNITYVNRKFTEVSGYTYEEAIGKNPRILKTEETPPAIFGELWRTITAGGIWQGEFVNKRKNGEHYWERALINPIIDEDGIITHYLAIKEDITELKKIESKSRDQSLALSITNAELMLAKEEAESANRMKSAFVANVSHEIRTPMNAILGFSEILLRDASLTGEQRQYLDTICRSGEHLLELINDVLEISRIESGRSTYNPAEIDVRLMLRDLESMFRVKTNEKSLRFSIEAEGSVPATIVTDKSKLRQILINLIGNALKFTQEGTVAVRVWGQPEIGRPGHIRLFADVEDTGSGIAAADMGKLFLVFSQTAVGATLGGTGLGLSISRKFARLLGGDIIVTSQLGKGSCFQVEILVEPGRDIAADSPPDRKATRLADDQNPWRILIVDDEELNRQILSNILGKVGFETQQAEDGEKAVTTFAEWRPDLVIMDVRMPNMDGYEATRRIKSIAQDKTIPVIGLSAGVFEEDRSNALACKMDAFVSKPFNTQNLLHTIARLLPVRYIYEELAITQPPRAVRDVLSLETELETIPHELAEQICASARGGDYFELLQLIDKAESGSPAFAGYLRDFALRYDYDACVAVLERRTKI